MAVTIGRTAITDDDGSLTTGTIINNAWKVELYDQIDAVLAGLSTTGTWTPVIGGDGGTSGQTYTSQSGRHIKIGRLVFVQGSAVLSAKGTITGNVAIQGLPFTCVAGAIDPASGAVRFLALASNWTHVIAVPQDGGTFALLQGNGSANTHNTTNLVTADIGNTTSLKFSFSYYASS